MGENKIKFSTKVSGLDAMIRALRDLAEGLPQAEARADLDAVLERTAKISQTLAHVSHDDRHAGHLKESISAHSEHGQHGWTGEVSTADRGARWEYGRGGSHAEFINDLAHLSAADYEAALDQMFKGL